MTSKTGTLPAWLNAERLGFAALGLTLIALVPIVETWRYADVSDWSGFAAAGRHVGTTILLHPLQWRESFVYTPGAAWLWLPFARLSLVAGFFVNAALMLLCAAACAAVAARLYGATLARSAALVFAWAPMMNAAVIGQTSPFGLLLALTAMLGMQRGSVALTALPLGMLLYKPTYAVPLIAVVALHAKWRELGIIALSAVVWYLLSVAATAGDWAFPVAWAEVIRSWNAGDVSRNLDKAISIPSLLARCGVPFSFAVAVGGAIAVATVPLLRRLPLVEAASAACLIGIAVSPHAWGYDAVLALPTVFVVNRLLREPARTAVLGAAYLLAALLTLTPLLHFDAVAVVVLAGLVWWFSRYRDPA